MNVAFLTTEFAEGLDSVSKSAAPGIPITSGSERFHSDGRVSRETLVWSPISHQWKDPEGIS